MGRLAGRAARRAGEVDSTWAMRARRAPDSAMELAPGASKITTAAALAAALLAGTAPKAAAQCPYTVGPLGRYIAPAIVQGMTATDDGAVEVWCTDALDGDDWYFTVDAKTDLRIYDRVDLVVDANGTPEDFSDDKVIDALYCHDCTED